jgi:chorismate mutase
LVAELDPVAPQAPAEVANLGARAYETGKWLYDANSEQAAAVWNEMDDGSGVGGPTGAPDTGPPAQDTLTTLIREADIPHDTIREALDTWQNGTRNAEGREHSSEELSVIDQASLAETRAELEGLWGSKLESNRSALNKYLDRHPYGEAIRNARLADGRPLASHAPFLQRLLPLALRPGNDLPTEDPKAERQAIEALMKSNRKAYFADEKMQSRYRELVRAR